MYGFGDDRNPANDTVNVMEEILIEYIVDVVREAVNKCDLSRPIMLTWSLFSARRLLPAARNRASR